MADQPLFPGYEPEPAPDRPGLSKGQRLTLRQLDDVRAGRHPLTRTPIHEQASREASRDDDRGLPFTCGTCYFRQLRLHNQRKYPKCVRPAFKGKFVKRSAQTDVRAWWPACPWYRAVDPV